MVLKSSQFCSVSLPFSWESCCCIGCATYQTSFLSSNTFKEPPSCFVMFSLRLRRISRKHPLFFFFVVWLGNSTVVVTPVFLLQTQRPVLPSWFPYTPPHSPQYLPVLTCDPCFDMHTAKSFLSVSRQGVDGQSLTMIGMDRGLRSWNLPFHLLGGCI